MATPIYKTLDATGGHIRLLALQPALSFSATIHCKLLDARLSLKPVFEALSYTWGGVGSGPSILLNDQPFNVFENLEAALRRLRRRRKTRVLWIDAISINQEDIKERAEQVTQMKDIYEQAEQVVVWLGEPGDGGRGGMRSLATNIIGLTNSFNMRNVERKNGLVRKVGECMSAFAVGEVAGILTDMEFGEVAELLNRPWWQRAWIIQEVVLARKAMVMCGRDEVSWDTINYRLTRPTWGLENEANLRRKLTVGGTVVEAGYLFPHGDYHILHDLRSKWQSGTWNASIYDLLYRFRGLKCSDARDRIYSVLGLVGDSVNPDLTADYNISALQLYLKTARGMIEFHKHLLMLNCRREAFSEGRLPPQAQVYSVIDQGKFVDPECRIVDGPGRKPRNGWLRLPMGWERQQATSGWVFNRRSIGRPWHFYDHNTQTSHTESPLSSKIPSRPSNYREFRTIPDGWQKTWDNLGRVSYLYKPEERPPTVDTRDKLSALPSWVPNWDSFSPYDPEPFPFLFGDDRGYCASGKDCPVKFSIKTLSPNVLALQGVLFDKIEVLGSSWCPEPQNLPVSRSGSATLEKWEELALQPVRNCPYKTGLGRQDAFWRTHIADYVGEKGASEDGGKWFDIWCDRTGWTLSLAVAKLGEYKSLRNWGYEIQSDVSPMGLKHLDAVKAHFNDLDTNPDFGVPTIKKHKSRIGAVWDVTKALSRIIARTLPGKGDPIHLIEKRLAFKKMASDYRELRSRIYRASVNRAMFVTNKGYIGLAPWNAKEGDLVCVLLGGCTPFLLRPVEGTDQFTLVGETYVYGIMAGEIFEPEAGQIILRDFEII